MGYRGCCCCCCCCDGRGGGGIYMAISCMVRNALARASYPSGVLSGLMPILDAVGAVLAASPPMARWVGTWCVDEFGIRSQRRVQL